MIPFYELSSLDNIPSFVKVIVVDNPQIKCKFNKKCLLVTDENKLEEVLFKSLSYLFGKEIFNVLIVGIDPGRTYGVVALADGFPLIFKAFNDVYSLVVFIEKLFHFSPSKERVIRIGTGGGVYFDLLLKSLWKTFLNFNLQTSIELVNESSVNSLAVKKFGFSVDVEDAYNIALTKGKKIEFGELYDGEDLRKK